MNSPKRRFVIFSTKQLLLAVAIVALSLTIWHRLTLRSVTIRPARANEAIEVHFPEEDVEVRTVAVIDGEIHGQEHINLTLSLFKVQNRQPDIIGNYALERRPVEEDD
ncbi:MAG: hypothetical protein AAF385_15745, partial [Pseudomonadota bacterium]